MTDPLKYTASVRKLRRFVAFWSIYATRRHLEKPQKSSVCTPYEPP